jgi:hypothetical protein
MSDPKEDQAPPLLRYVGDGSARIAGVPLRDLTKADVATLAPEALREAMASRLYQRTEGVPPPMNPAATGDLEAMTRAELDAYAADAGVDAPESLPNKTAVIEAIRARSASGGGRE